MAEKKRFFNLDILKIVSMLMIVSLHYFNHGGLLEALTPNDFLYMPVWFLDILSMVSVNCFIMCTGYLISDSEHKTSKLTGLWLQLFFTNAVCYVAAVLIKATPFSLRDAVSLFFPVIISKYWYLTAYFIFYLLSPIFIRAAKNSSIQELKKICIILVLLFSVIPVDFAKIYNGFHFVWFIVLFFVAEYIKRADALTKSSKYYFVMSVSITVINVAIRYIADNFAPFLTRYSEQYNSVMVFAASVMFFAAFKNLKLSEKSTKKYGKAAALLSSLTLGVYLIHVNPYLVEPLWKGLIAPLKYKNSPMLFVSYILSVVGVYAACSLLEYLRQLLFKLLKTKKLTDAVGNALDNALDKISNIKAED